MRVCAPGLPTSRDREEMCRVLEVSRSGFHAWERRREPPARAVADQALTDRIAEIHTSSLKTYGSPRIHAELRFEDDVRVGRERVERLMRRAGLSGQVKRRRGKTTISVQGVRTAPDLVQRDFNPTEPNRLRAADITSLRAQPLTRSPAPPSDPQTVMVHFSPGASGPHFNRP
jgi:putative transposase